jgi:hypothetical protein
MKMPKDIEGYFFEDCYVLGIRDALRSAYWSAIQERDSYIHEHGRSKSKNGMNIKWLNQKIEKAEFLIQLIEERQYCLFLSKLPEKGEIHRITISKESLHPAFIKPQFNQ